MKIPSPEFWAYPIGLVEDMISVRQIMDGAEEIPVAKKETKAEINYNDDSIWDLR